MELSSVNDGLENADLIRRASEGDQSALDKLFCTHRDRLQRMIRLRMDRRIQGPRATDMSPLWRAGLADSQGLLGLRAIAQVNQGQEKARSQRAGLSCAT